jgi:DNA-binding NarL/FixJ family response regulator
MRPTRIMLVDDHALISELLRMRLEAESFLHVVTVSASADQAIEGARKYGPDFIITDIEMPGLNIFDALRLIRLDLPGVGLIFLSAYTSDHYIQQALELEARAYLTKDEPLDTLVRAIRKALTGGHYFSPGIQARLLISPRGISLADAPRSRAHLLTNREKEVLGYVAQGLSKREIAEVMMISVKTVDNHCCHLMTKLDIHDRVQLARFALREGYVQL